MAVLKSKFQKLATKLISDKFADFRVAFRVFKESDSYDPRTGESGDSESYDLQAIPLEIEDAQRVFANATNDNIYLVALKAGSSQEFDTSYTAEYDGFLYSIERVIDDPADAAYFFSLVGGSKKKAPQPTTRFAPNFNGISQYALLQQSVTMNAGSWFEFYAQSSTARNNKFIGTQNYGGFAVGIDAPSGKILVYVDNVFTFVGNISKPLGSMHKFRGEYDGSVFTLYVDDEQKNQINCSPPSYNLIGSALGEFMLGTIRDYSDSLGNIYAMDDGWQNNPTMRNTGSGDDGTYINMTEAAWQEIPL